MAAPTFVPGPLFAPGHPGTFPLQNQFSRTATLIFMIVTSSSVILIALEQIGRISLCLSTFLGPRLTFPSFAPVGHVPPIGAPPGLLPMPAGMMPPPGMFLPPPGMGPPPGMMVPPHPMMMPPPGFHGFAGPPPGMLPPPPVRIALPEAKRSLL